MTDSCERCGSPSPEALLRNIELRVDGSEVDGQRICPDCFSDWIAHYQEQMAGDMPGAGTAGGSGGDDSALNRTVEAAGEQGGASPESGTAGHTVDGNENATEPAPGGDEIREVGGGTPAGNDDGVEVDLGHGAEDDDEDDDGLLLG